MKKKRKMKKRVRRRIALIVILLLFTLIGFIIDKIVNREEPFIYEDVSASINEYYVYGTHFNMNGTLPLEDLNYESISLLLDKDLEESIDVNIIKTNTGISFSISENINDGYYLDILERGEYNLCFKVSYLDEETSKDLYYRLENKTEYDKSIYYTMSKYNNKITITTLEDTLSFIVEKNKDKEIYDITIDPGHSGYDSGANVKDINEANYVMDLAYILKEQLEKEGYKVKLTHKKGQYTDTFLNDYKEGGRAVICNEVKSKYLLSLHLNSDETSKSNGFEIYTPGFIDYDFADSIASNLKKIGFNASDKVFSKVSNGVYTYMLSEDEFNYLMLGYLNEPHNRADRSNYFFMIRETGGYMSGAILTDEVSQYDYNPYSNSNIGNESYLLELGYITNNNDYNFLLMNQKEIAKAIKKAIIKECGIVKEEKE